MIFIIDNEDINMSNREYNPVDYANIADNDTIIDTTIKAALDNIVNTCDICRVVSIENNRCDVELLQGGKIIDVPILSPAFNGWTFSCPIKKDDTGLLVYTKYESDEYFTNGSFACSELAMFSKNNALFIPFALYNQPAVTDDIIITNENVNITINKDNEISVTNGKASLLIDKEGGLAVTCESDITIETQKDINITCNNASIETQANAEIKASGNVTVEGVTVSFCGATAAQGAVAVGSPCPLTGTHSKGSSKVFAPGT